MSRQEFNKVESNHQLLYSGRARYQQSRPRDDASFSSCTVYSSPALIHPSIIMLGERNAFSLPMVFPYLSNALP